MKKNKVRDAKGISLVTLAVAVVVLMILANIIIYNTRDSLKVGKLKEMQTDIENLRDKISSYYAQNGKIPAKLEYTNINHLKVAGVISEAVDTGRFLVIDLSAIENLTLNRGKDYETIKTYDTLREEQAGNYTDLYIINETSHNIFYVAGVKVDNETYYTDTDQVDTVPVDLRYVEGIKIPEGFHYTGGTKAEGNISIKNADETEEYQWIGVENEIATVPSDVSINTNETADFIKSVNRYQGYYKNTANNTVKYFTLERWSPTYDKEGIYQDKNGDTAYIPKGFSVSENNGENTIDGGLVVKDSNQNEWVWIEVPKSIYTNTAYNGGTAPTSSEDYSKIESVMQAYASDYRQRGYTDTFYSTAQHGFSSSTEYDNWKNSMLKSVYEKGGFYIGRYEIGIENARTASSTELPTPLIQRDKYPYMYITCSQAQTLAKQLKTGDKTSSLMFGIQWDLVLKFIEEKGTELGETKTERQTKLKTNSTDWGNYREANFTIERGKYAIYNTTNSTLGEWKVTNNTSKEADSLILLTTGATDRNSVLELYDLAGNTWEWTLEYTDNTNLPCALRGGRYGINGSTYPASSRLSNSDSSSNNFIGFRPALW